LVLALMASGHRRWEKVHLEEQVVQQVEPSGSSLTELMAVHRPH
jgi:hypothetical protein